MSLSLSSLLGSLRIEMVDAAIVELSQPGAVRIGGGRGYLHYVLSGSAHISNGRLVGAARLQEGAFAVVIQSGSHVLADAPGRVAADASYFNEIHLLDRLPTVRFGGVGRASSILTCAFPLPTSAGRTLNGLPNMLVSRRSDLFSPERVWEALLGAGAMAFAAALTDLCFVHAVRTALLEVVSPADAMARMLQHPQVGAAVKMVNTHPQQRWTVASLAGAVGMSRSAFAQAFKSATGEAPAEYVTGVRMEQAASLLADTRTRVSDIARRVGYRSDSSFIRAFRQRFGAAPNEYRGLGRKLRSRSHPALGHWDPFLP